MIPLPPPPSRDASTGEGEKGRSPWQPPRLPPRRGVTLLPSLLSSPLALSVFPLPPSVQLKPSMNETGSFLEF